MWDFIAGKPAPTKRINIAESNLALQAAAEIENWLGKSHQAELRLQQFKIVWPSDDAQTIASLRTSSPAR